MSSIPPNLWIDFCLKSNRMLYNYVDGSNSDYKCDEDESYFDKSSHICYNSQVFDPFTTLDSYKMINQITELPMKLKDLYCEFNRNSLFTIAYLLYISTINDLQLNGIFDMMKASLDAKNASDTLRINVLTILIIYLNYLSHNRKFISLDTTKKINEIMVGCLFKNDDSLKILAGEVLGRLYQVTKHNEVLVHTSDICVNSISKTNVNMNFKTSSIFALGCILRRLGGTSSVNLLQHSINIFISFVRQSSNSTLQIWSIHALILLAESGGPTFLPYAEGLLLETITLQLITNHSEKSISDGLARLISTLVTSMGPDISGESVEKTKLAVYVYCHSMLKSKQPALITESINCLQQIYLYNQTFSPGSVTEFNELTKIATIDWLVPKLCTLIIDHPSIRIRKAASSCLRQLAQIQPNKFHNIKLSFEKTNLTLVGKFGIKGILFGMLDLESDNSVIDDLHETIISILQNIDDESIESWFLVCKQVLLASKSENETELDVTDNNTTQHSKNNNGEDFAGNEENDENMEKIVQTNPNKLWLVLPKWTTRFFAIRCLDILIQICYKVKDEKEVIFKNLTEFMRITSFASTSSCHHLNFLGLTTLKNVVETFSTTSDPFYPDQLILEQYQAQVIATLRPAFTLTSTPETMSVACEVCSSWLRHGIAKSTCDVERFQKLLRISLKRVDNNDCQTLWNETAHTLERLSVLNAWAQLYIESHLQGSDNILKPVNLDHSSTNLDLGSSLNLLKIVNDDLPILTKLWMHSIIEYVLIIYSNTSKKTTKHYVVKSPTNQIINIEYSNTSYIEKRPEILLAVTIYFVKNVFNDNDNHQTIAEFNDILSYRSIENDGSLEEPEARETKESKETVETVDINYKLFLILMACIMDALCDPVNCEPRDRMIECALKSTDYLLTSKLCRKFILSQPNNVLADELIDILFRIILAHGQYSIRIHVIRIMLQISTALIEHVNDTNIFNKSSFNTIIDNILKICAFIIGSQWPQFMPGIESIPVSRSITSKENSIIILQNIGDCCLSISSLIKHLNDYDMIGKILRIMFGCISVSGCLKITPQQNSSNDHLINIHRNIITTFLNIIIHKFDEDSDFISLDCDDRLSPLELVHGYCNHLIRHIDDFLCSHNKIVFNVKEDNLNDEPLKKVSINLFGNLNVFDWTKTFICIGHVLVIPLELTLKHHSIHQIFCQQFHMSVSVAITVIVQWLERNHEVVHGLVELIWKIVENDCSKHLLRFNNENDSTLALFLIKFVPFLIEDHLEKYLHNLTKEYINTEISDFHSQHITKIFEIVNLLGAIIDDSSIIAVIIKALIKCCVPYLSDKIPSYIRFFVLRNIQSISKEFPQPFIWALSRINNGREIVETCAKDLVSFEKSKALGNQTDNIGHVINQQPTIQLLANFDHFK